MEDADEDNRDSSAEGTSYSFDIESDSSVSHASHYSCHYTYLSTNVPELKEIAAVNVAVALWNHADLFGILSDVTNKQTRHSSEWSSLEAAVFNSTNELQVPNSVFEFINTYVRKIQDQIEEWVSYHYRAVFFKNREDLIVYNYIGCIIWYPDGSINYKETAKNLFSCDRVRVMEKYFLMCTYCLKNELEQLWPSLPVLIVDYLDFDSHPLIYYWTCYFKNELSKIPAPAEENSSIDSMMCKHRYVENWPAKEYFFDRLTDDEKLPTAVFLIDEYEVKYQKLMLMKLTDSQRLDLCVARAVKIIENYANAETDYSRDILSTWLDIRNYITQDQFILIFKALLKTWSVHNILIDVWASACDNFKSYLLNYNNHEIIETVFAWWKWMQDKELLFAMLFSASENLKETIIKSKFFEDFCGILIASNKIPVLDRLLNLCALDGLNLVLFKRNILTNSKSVENQCLRWYSMGYLKPVNEMLNQLLSPHTNLITEYKKNLLMSSEAIKYCATHFHSETNLLYEIIVDGLPDANLAAEFIRRIAFSSSVIDKLQKMIKDDRLNDVEKYINRYLASNEDKEMLKTQLIGDPERLIREVFFTYDELWWQSLMLWYLGDEKKVEKFKRTLSVDHIFEEMLMDCIFEVYDDFERSPKVWSDFGPASFVSLDRFLIWYFSDSHSAVKMFKLQKVDSYESLSAINILLKREDDKNVKVVMNWFYENIEVSSISENYPDLPE